MRSRSGPVRENRRQAEHPRVILLARVVEQNPVTVVGIAFRQHAVGEQRVVFVEFDVVVLDHAGAIVPFDAPAIDEPWNRNFGRERRQRKD